MAESDRLKIILLLTAVVTLATDVVRLALELTPAHTRRDTIEQAGPGRHETDGQAPEWRDPGAPRFPQIPRPLERADARGPPRGPRETGSAPSARRRPDFIIDRPQWCRGCGPPMQRPERRRYDGRYYEWYDEW
jgi:hypothetical protein